MKNDVNVYFIMTGNYKVQTYMWNLGNQKQESDKSKEETAIEKNLRTGDMFGEVSLLFGCRRTATVMAKQYCECAYIENTPF